VGPRLPRISCLTPADESLLQYRDLCALHNPSRHDLKTLREWLTRTECGDNFLEGVERNIFPHHERLDSTDHERVSDLVTLSPEAVERDAFSRWMTDELLHKFHNLIGHRFKVGIPLSHTDRALFGILTMI
jgi:hypothetical protein